MGCCDSKSNQIEPDANSSSNNQTLNNNQQHSSTLASLKEEEEQEQKQDAIIIDNNVVMPSTSGTNKVIEEMTNKSLNESINETKSKQLENSNSTNNNDLLEISKSVIDQRTDENIINDKLDTRPKSAPITNVIPLNQIENNENSLITND